MTILIEVDNVLRDLNGSMLKYYDEFIEEKENIVIGEVQDDEYNQQTVKTTRKTGYVWQTDVKPLNFEDREEFNDFIRTYTYEFLFSSSVNKNIKPLVCLLRQKKYNVVFGVDKDVIPNTLTNKKTTLHYFIKNEVEFDGILSPDNNISLSMAYMIRSRNNQIELVEKGEVVLTDNIFLQNILNFFQNL